MVEIRLERKLLPNLLLDISVSVSPRRTVRKLKVGRWSDNQGHFLGAAKNTSDWNIARIAKAALHKFPGKSSLNVNFVYIDCPVSPVCLVCLVYPVSPDDDHVDHVYHVDHVDHVNHDDHVEITCRTQNSLTAKLSIRRLSDQMRVHCCVDRWHWSLLTHSLS